MGLNEDLGDRENIGSAAVGQDEWTTAPEPQAKPENIAPPQPFELQAAHDPCGLPAALHERDGRCHVIMSCEGRYARATVKLVKGVWKLDCSWKPQR